MYILMTEIFCFHDIKDPYCCVLGYGTIFNVEMEVKMETGCSCETVVPTYKTYPVS
jgi:hypothetical protein